MNNEYKDQELFVGDWKEGRLEVPQEDHTRTTSEDAEGTRRIPLSKGKWALVDEEDYTFLIQWKWSFGADNYAIRFTSGRGGIKRKMIFMHRVVNKTPDGMQTDHINGNRIDNRKSNLRTCSVSQNCMNKGRHPSNTSGFKGVYWHKNDQRWVARIKLNGVYKSLGNFHTPELAHSAYCQAALKLHGEFARTH